MTQFDGFLKVTANNAEAGEEDGGLMRLIRNGSDEPRTVSAYELLGLGKRRSIGELLSTVAKSPVVSYRSTLVETNTLRCGWQQETKKG